MDYIDRAMYEIPKRQLTAVWLLPLILLVSRHSTAIEIASSTTIESQFSLSSSSEMTTPLAAISNVYDSVTLSELMVSTSATISNIDATTSLPRSNTLISATSVIIPPPQTTNNQTNPNSTIIPKTTVNPNNTPPVTTPSGVVGNTNVTCSVGGNFSDTDCKEYQGQNDQTLSTPVIIGIAVGSAASVVLIAVAIAICCARKKQRLSGSKADLSSYWEDNVTLSYINGHVDSPRDYPDEMISLDNDSFLNSLDNMSFSNIWTAENAKHTNF